MGLVLTIGAEFSSPGEGWRRKKAVSVGQQRAQGWSGDTEKRFRKQRKQGFVRESPWGWKPLSSARRLQRGGAGAPPRTTSQNHRGRIPGAATAARPVPPSLHLPPSARLAWGSQAHRDSEPLRSLEPAQPLDDGRRRRKCVTGPPCGRGRSRPSRNPGVLGLPVERRLGLP